MIIRIYGQQRTKKIFSLYLCILWLWNAFFSYSSGNSASSNYMLSEL